MDKAVIRARRIELVDDQGKLKMTLDHMGIRLWGKDGKMRGSLGLLTNDMPQLMFFHGPVPRVNLRLEDEGVPSLTLVDNRTLEVAELCIRAWDKEDQGNQQQVTKKKAQSRK